MGTSRSQAGNKKDTNCCQHSQSNTLALASVATFIAAASCIELPRDIDADTTRVFVFAILGADVNAAVCRALRVLRMQNIVGEDGNAKTLILQELFTKLKIYESRGFDLTGSRLIIRCEAA